MKKLTYQKIYQTLLEKPEMLALIEAYKDATPQHRRIARKLLKSKKKQSTR